MHLKEIILQTNSLHRTRLFYHKTLELDIVAETEGAVSFKAGKSILTFEEVEGAKPVYHFAFNIVNNKFSDSFEWINNKLDILPVDDMLIAGYDDWNAQSFYFHDNNHNIVEFITRFDLPYHSTEEFSPACITEVSEIGLVVTDVPATVLMLKERYDIPHFRKGPVLHDFVAMGDDYGLLLVCQEKRGWVPTRKPAQVFPVTIVLEDGKRIEI